MPGPSTPLQGQLAVIAREDDEEMKKLFSSIDSRKQIRRALYLGLQPRAIQFDGAINHYPVIRINPFPVTNPDIQSCLKHLDDFTHCIFTSKNSAKLLLSHLK